MVNVFLRTIILYILIVTLMRLTGKRQIGQLEITELVTAFMISELAASPISDNTIPLLYGVIPAVTLVCLEVFLSYISIKSRTFRRLVAGNALALIKNGQLDEKQMKKARITVEELVSAMRMSGVGSLKCVEYAFLEPGGNISIIVKETESPPSAEVLGIKIKNAGIEHPVIVDGRVNFKTLEMLGFNESWLRETIKSEGYSNKKDIFYLGVNDLGEIYTVGKEKEK